MTICLVWHGREANGSATWLFIATADERFLVQMPLTCYRLNPTGVKQRMLDLMEGELSKVQHRKRKSADGA